MRLSSMQFSQISFMDRRQVMAAVVTFAFLIIWGMAKKKK